MKVFVTGNLGYIGSVLTEILLEKNIDFIGYDKDRKIYYQKKHIL